MKTNTPYNEWTQEEIEEFSKIFNKYGDVFDGVNETYGDVSEVAIVSQLEQRSPEELAQAYYDLFEMFVKECKRTSKLSAELLEVMDRLKQSFKNFEELAKIAKGETL